MDNSKDYQIYTEDEVKSMDTEFLDDEIRGNSNIIQTLDFLERIGGLSDNETKFQYKLLKEQELLYNEHFNRTHEK